MEPAKARELLKSVGVDGSAYSDDALAELSPNQVTRFAQFKASQPAPEAPRPQPSPQPAALTPTAAPTPLVAGMPAVNEMHPELGGSRFAVSNFGDEANPDTIKYLVKQHPDMQFTVQDGKVLGKKPEEKEWKYLNPPLATLSDLPREIADHAADVGGAGIQALAAMAAGPLSGGAAAPIMGAAGAGVEFARSGIGALLGLRDTGDYGLSKEDWANIAKAGAVNAAIPTAALTGKYAIPPIASKLSGVSANTFENYLQPGFRQAAKAVGLSGSKLADLIQGLSDPITNAASNARKAVGKKFDTVLGAIHNMYPEGVPIAKYKDKFAEFIKPFQEALNDPNASDEVKNQARKIISALNPSIQTSEEELVHVPRTQTTITNKDVTIPNDGVTQTQVSAQRQDSMKPNTNTRVETIKNRGNVDTPQTSTSTTREVTTMVPKTVVTAQELPDRLPIKNVRQMKDALTNLANKGADVAGADDAVSRDIKRGAMGLKSALTDVEDSAFGDLSKASDGNTDVESLKSVRGEYEKALQQEQIANSYFGDTNNPVTGLQRAKKTLLDMATDPHLQLANGTVNDLGVKSMVPDFQKNLSLLEAASRVEPSGITPGTKMSQVITDIIRNPKYAARLMEQLGNPNLSAPMGAATQGAWSLMNNPMVLNKLKGRN